MEDFTWTKCSSNYILLFFWPFLSMQLVLGYFSRYVERSINWRKRSKGTMGQKEKRMMKRNGGDQEAKKQNKKFQNLRQEMPELHNKQRSKIEKYSRKLDLGCLEISIPTMPQCDCIWRTKCALTISTWGWAIHNYAGTSKMHGSVYPIFIYPPQISSYSRGQHLIYVDSV